MNAERLVEVLTKLNVAIDAAQVDSRLQQIDSALQQMITQPTVAQFQTQMVQSIDELRSALRNEAVDSFGPVWIQSVKDLGLQSVLPASILSSLDAIFQRSQLTPAVAQQELRELRDAVVAATVRIKEVLTGLNAFGITEHKVPIGKAEIGVLIPRAAVHNNLDQFGTEAKLLNRLLTSIGEAVSGVAEEIPIESISTSDFLIYVFVGCTIAQTFATTLSKLVECYERILKVRALSDELKAQGLNEKQLAGPKEFANAEMDKVIDLSVKEIMAASGQPVPRKNELKTLLKKALWGLAKRLDDGYNFDVRANSEAEESEDPSEKNAATTINAVRKSLEFFKVAGEPILQLPPGTNGDEADLGVAQDSPKVQ